MLLPLDQYSVVSAAEQPVDTPVLMRCAALWHFQHRALHSLHDKFTISPRRHTNQINLQLNCFQITSMTF